MYMYKENDLNLCYRKKNSVELSDSKDYTTWQSHLHGFDIQIRSKRIRWFPPRIREHPSVLISKNTARNKACQTIQIRRIHLPEAYMEPSEYILTADKQYKRVTTWTDLTKVDKNDESTCTQTTKSTNKLTMTECHRTNAESDRKTDMLLSSQLLDDDEGPTEYRPGQTPNKRVADSEGLSYESASMRMVQQLGHLCTN